MNKIGNLIVVSGPSGVGKGTVCASLLNEEKNIAYSISATTRKMREGEVEGESYYFMDAEQFKKKIENNEFLEWAYVYGNYYGTLKEKVLARLEAGKDVLLEIDTVGAMQIKEKMKEALLIFILPPDKEELENRLRKRNTDSDAVIEKRLKCLDKELEDSKMYDYRIVNDEVDKTVKEILDIIHNHNK